MKQIKISTFFLALSGLYIILAILINFRIVDRDVTELILGSLNLFILVAFLFKIIRDYMSVWKKVAYVFAFLILNYLFLLMVSFIELMKYGYG